MFRKALILVALLSVAIVVWDRGLPTVPPIMLAPDGEAAFGAWLEDDVERAASFSAFEDFLRSRGVAEIVPSWQLMRVDAFYAGKCDVDPFAIPPERLWPSVVPALTLVRDTIKPELGAVIVQSSYRSPEVNRCARGASRSKHLGFAALDLITQDRQNGERLYRKLCAIHAEAGPRSKMGLGAYYDAAEPGYSGGRFHIDGEGFRSWARDYRAASSPCRVFN